MPDQKYADTDIDPLADIRAQLHELLPRAVRCAVASYRDFSQNVSPDDAKQFIAHHNACRAALSHLESLSKLTRWLIAQKPDKTDTDTLQPLLLQARHVLMRLDHPALTDDENLDDNFDESGTAEF